MVKNAAKDRGPYPHKIEIGYITIPHEVLSMYEEEYSFMPEEDRNLALAYYMLHYFKGEDYDILKTINQRAFLICSAFDKCSEIVQNNARWACNDKLYKGNPNQTYQEALDKYNEAKRSKKKRDNAEDYQNRKLKKHQIYDPEEEKAKEEKTLEELKRKFNL